MKRLHFRASLLFLFHLSISRVGEIVVNYPFNIGKTLNSIDLVNLMSSISVRFNSFSFFIRFSMNVIASAFAEWSVWMDSNHRPHAYQACALTT